MHVDWEQRMKDIQWKFQCEEDFSVKVHLPVVSTWGMGPPLQNTEHFAS